MYIKTNWQNDVTEVDATHMNHIEDGIEAVDHRVDNTNEFIIKKIVELLEVGSAPITCVEGDKYFNTTTNKIYTATAINTWGTTGEDAQKNAIYYVINTKKTYVYNGTTLINIGDVGGINVVNEHSTSETDVYSANYVNSALSDKQNNGILLYSSNSTTASTSDINLNDSLANYNYVEIFFKDSVLQSCGSVKIYQPNNKVANMYCMFQGSSGTNCQFKNANYNLSGNKMTLTNNYGEATANDNGYSSASKTLQLIVYRVIGYK